MFARNLSARLARRISTYGMQRNALCFYVATCAPLVQCCRFAATDSAEATAPPSNSLLPREDVIARVVEVVKNFEKVDASKVTGESHFINDLGLDSLDVVEVVMALEQEFCLDIPDHDAERIQSISDAVEYISKNPIAK